MSDATYRRGLISSAKRIVVKVGSGVLTGAGGLNTRRVGALAGQIAACRSLGIEVVLVSSGAIASGFKKVGLSEKPQTVRQQAACAAVGQAGLVMTYEKAFKKRGYKVAQVLLTADDLSHRRRYLNARNTMTTLLEWGVIPIINENDTVVVAELKFGDNDTLASMVTALVEADLFINLTDMDGLYDRDPRLDRAAQFIPVVESVGARIEAMASRIPGALGAGGMYTKILAARRLARQGIPSIIASGARSDTLVRIMNGEQVGTLFLPRAKTIKSRKNWIAFTAKPKGRIIIDDGAKKAILGNGKSLLPPGIMEVRDAFHLGDSVRVIDKQGELVAVGLTNYSSEELGHIIGCHTCDIEERLGYKHSDEIIHRDNMVIGKDLGL